MFDGQEKHVRRRRETEEQWEGVINEQGEEERKKTFPLSIYCGQTGGERKKEKTQQIERKYTIRQRNSLHADSIINLFPLSLAFLQKVKGHQCFILTETFRTTKLKCWNAPPSA